MAIWRGREEGKRQILGGAEGEKRKGREGAGG
jgi:hypothetical protein